MQRQGMVADGRGYDAPRRAARRSFVRGHAEVIESMQHAWPRELWRNLRLARPKECSGRVAAVNITDHLASMASGAFPFDGDISWETWEISNTCSNEQLPDDIWKMKLGTACVGYQWKPEFLRDRHPVIRDPFEMMRSSVVPDYIQGF